MLGFAGSGSVAPGEFDRLVPGRRGGSALSGSAVCPPRREGVDCGVAGCPTLISMGGTRVLQGEFNRLAPVRPVVSAADSPADSPPRRDGGRAGDPPSVFQGSNSFLPGEFDRLVVGRRCGSVPNAPTSVPGVRGDDCCRLRTKCARGESGCGGGRMTGYDPVIWGARSGDCKDRAPRSSAGNSCQGVLRISPWGGGFVHMLSGLPDPSGRSTFLGGIVICNMYMVGAVVALEQKDALSAVTPL